MLHALKTNQPYFDDVAIGDKPFEVRIADRPFVVGDVLALNEWDGQSYTGRFLVAEVTYILKDPQYVKDGYVILGIFPARLYTAASFRLQSYCAPTDGRGYEVYGNIGCRLEQIEEATP